MKRKMVVYKMSVYLGGPITVCDKCRHTRVNEPYVHKVYRRGGGKERYETICWRCCRDAESTLLIKQKWPLAFRTYYHYGHWYLDWTEGVKEWVGDHAKL